MADDFFLKKTDLVIDSYRENPCAGPRSLLIFNKLADLYVAGSTAQMTRHIPICKLCGEQAYMNFKGRHLLLPECMIKIDHPKFSVFIRSIFLHLSQAHGYCLSIESEKVVLDGDLACYEQLVATRPKIDPDSLPELDADGW